MAKFTITISDKDIKRAIKSAAVNMGYELKKGFKVADIQKEMEIDIKGIVANDLTEFFEGGIDGCAYENVLTESDEES